MKRLGEYLHSTRTGLLIIKSVYKDPRKLVGALVYDRSMRRVGKIVDVIGPVDSPFIVVKPESKDIVDLVEPGPMYYFVEKRIRFRKRPAKKSEKRRKKSRKK